MASTRTLNESFIRVRLVRFSDGTEIQPLSNVKLRIDTLDFQQTSSHRPKFPSYVREHDSIFFDSRTIQGRKIVIGAFLEPRKTNYVCTISIEDLIRDADQTIREYRFTGKSRAWMSVELFLSKDVREPKRSEQEHIRKHFGHEFLEKYFTSLPVFCSVCKKMLWGFNTPGYRCQLCDQVVHQHCIEQVAVCKQLSFSRTGSMPVIAHKFRPEPNYLPVFCDHDGKMIRPLRAWKCSECGMVIHLKCQAKVAQFCGTRQAAVKLYEEWKKENIVSSVSDYIISEEAVPVETEEKNRTVLINIYERLKNENENPLAKRELEIITKPLISSDDPDQNISPYYNRSALLLHTFTFQAAIGRGMSGSVYWVKYSNRDYALKAIRKHRIFEANDFECVKNERDILISCRENPFIIRVFAVFHDFQRVYFLLEYAPCGAFYEFFLRCGPEFDNKCIQWFSGQIVCAISFLHSKLVLHRDLKPENVLLMRDGRLKLADFGFCKQMKDREDTARTFCGTLEYIAPEIYQAFRYSFPVDYWSLGVMIYEMFAMQTPFYHSSEKEIKDHVMNRDFQFPGRMPGDLQDLLNGMLEKDPRKRFTMDQIRSHRYYSSPFSLDEIEQLKARCPFKRAIPVNPIQEINDSSSGIQLSQIDGQALCATHTLNTNKFRQFSFNGF